MTAGRLASGRQPMTRPVTATMRVHRAAVAYQVRQVLDAIARLEAEKNEESDNDA